MNTQGLLYIDYVSLHSRFLLQNKENFDPVSKTFAGVHRNSNNVLRTNSKLMNFVPQRNNRDPLREIFLYQEETISRTVANNTHTHNIARTVNRATASRDTEIISTGPRASTTTNQDAKKKKKNRDGNKRSRATKPRTKPITEESLLKLR
ncbi:12162_t:CDS:1 [Funneliformis mosseae]|uniref:12162_t:CDS:1 n=1 Tax=Funneliformis mosseae TaxID=27381 RepID=A0A9N9GM73_FUNMO|nr:12162_t:CDS:1 [Funneliformis mosseae]